MWIGTYVSRMYYDDIGGSSVIFFGHVYIFFVYDTATTEIYTYGHTLSLHDALPIFPSAGLIPHHPSAPMFVNSGMMPFVPYFLGEEVPPYDPPRATSVQRCVRAGGKHNDLDAIGRSRRHLSFFEMLGNFSFGDYFKADAKIGRAHV